MAGARMTSGMVDASFNVVMAAYNASATIESAIQSVLQQTRSDLELIVVDDGSTDDTARRVDQFRSDPRVRLVRQENLGPSAARNAAISAGCARYVTILDADDLLLPTHLERIGSALDTTPDAGFAFADALRLDDRSGRFWRQTVMTARGAPRPVPTDPAALLPALVKANFVPIMFTVRRTALESVGGFRQGERKLAEDWELLLRLVAFGYAPVVVAGVLGVYRRNVPGSFTTNHTWMSRVARETLRVFVDEHPASDDIKAAARIRIGQLEAELKRRARRREPHPVLASARKWLRGPASLIRGDSLCRHPPGDIAAVFPDLANRRATLPS
jgi:glycosyltransferase involved in cell wall biosynthesis